MLTIFKELMDVCLIDLHGVQIGVPQSSVLVPLLLIIVCQQYTQQCNSKMFIDDTKIHSVMTVLNCNLTLIGNAIVKYLVTSVCLMLLNVKLSNFGYSLPVYEGLYYKCVY